MNNPSRIPPANPRSDPPNLPLRASESRYRRLFETARDGILLLNADSAQIEDVNPYLIEKLGYSKAEFLGKKLWEVGSFADIPESKDMFAELQATGYVRYDDLPLRTKAGARFEVEFVSNLYDCDGVNVIQCNIRDITERKQAERKLQAMQLRYRAVTDSATDAIVTSNAAGCIVGWNPSAERMFGYAEAEVIDKELTLLIPQRFHEPHLIGMRRVQSGGDRHVIGKIAELVGRRKDGAEFPIELSLSEWTGEEDQFFTGMIRDITERKAAEGRLRRHMNLYSALSQCNRAILHCNSEEALFNEVCKAAVEFGGMSFAWVGIPDAVTSIVRPVASFGDGLEFLKSIEISVEALSPFGLGPTGTAIRENRPFWCNDIPTDPATVPWRERSARSGWAGIASLPLHREGRVFGAFVVYAREANAFDEHSRALLAEMAEDISFALDNFAREAQRRQSEVGLRAAEGQFRGLVEQSIAGIYIIQDGKLAYVNPRAAEIVDQGTVDDLIGTDPLVYVAEADRGHVAESMRRLLAGEAKSLALDFGWLRRDGVVIQVGVNGAYATHEGRPAIIGLLQDISEKKRADEQIQRYVEQVRTAFMSTVEVATTLGEMRDPYTAGHQRRVAELAVAIGTELDFDARRQEGLRVAGYLHDIGKITVPAEILSKPGKLSAAEFQLIKGHPQAGYEVLKGVEFPWPVAQVALQHHERLDGSGYPQGLKAEQILFEARIIAVADVIEAMATHRPYRAAIGIDKALAEIEQGRGRTYDPATVDACVKLFREKGFAFAN